MAKLNHSEKNGKKSINDSALAVCDFSTPAMRKKALIKKALTHQSTLYPAAGFVGSVLWAIILGLDPLVFVIGIATFGATCISWVWHCFLSPKPENLYEKLLARGVTVEDFNNFLRPSVETLQEINNLLNEFEFSSGEFKRKVTDLRDIIQAILENCTKDDPSDIRRIPNFPSHIRRTANLLKKYAELQRKTAYSEIIRESLSDIEKSIPTLYDHYVKLFDRLQQNDVQGLEVEAETLERILKS